MKSCTSKHVHALRECDARFPQTIVMDLTDKKIQQKIYELFASRDETLVPPHTTLKSFENRCENDKFDTLTFGQAVVHFLSRLLAHPENKNRGFLVWHSTGSGKMCAAAAVADAFWDSGRKVYYVTTAALNNTSQAKFAKCAQNIFPRFKNGEPLTKVEFSTYAIIAHIMQKGLLSKDSVLIFDEVHNLFHPLPTQQREHTYVLNAILEDTFPDLKIIIMTATPGSNREELLMLLNIVRDRKTPVLKFNPNLDEFSRSIVGLVSYIDNSKDYSMFPKITKVHDVDAEMHPNHFLKYIEKMEDTPDSDTQFVQGKERRYWVAARKYSNSQYDYTEDMEIAEFSSKVNQLTLRIANFPSEKHFVYSAFYEKRGSGGGHGVNTIAMILKKHFGYEQYTTQMATNDVKNGTVPSPKKRFIIFTSRELTGGSTSLKEEKRNKQNVLEMFNHPDNKHGELIHVLLASQGYNEGIDLLSVRHVHLFEPLVTYQDEQQTIGRVVRHCSHRQLKKDLGEWTVNIHRYFSSTPTSSLHAFIQSSDIVDPKMSNIVSDANLAETLMVDKKIFKEARERIKEMTLLQSCLKRAAMDCILTSEFHGYEVECIHDYKST